jgi:Fur family ferric uptake transcriptional regulator
MTAQEILKQHVVKKTPARMAMIRALQSSSCPMSEAEIKEKMSDLYDRVTFYRNVLTLVEAGIIHKIVADNTTIRYALNCCEHGHQHSAEHAHFFCENCHAVVCMKEIKIPEYNLPTGYKFADCDVIIKGTCGICTEKSH